MKLFVCAIFLTALAVDLSQGKGCRSSDECDEGQCCAGYMPFRGNCKALSKEKAKCLVDERVFPFNDIYILTCPCDEGLECVQEANAKEGKENNGKCQQPATTTEETKTPSAEGSGETTGDQSTSGETTADQSTSGETTADQSTSGETTADQSTSGETTADQGSSAETTQNQSGEAQTESA